MQLKDIADMEEYLANRCYCPNEIYDSSGFFFNIFPPETECELLAEGSRGAIHGKFVIAKATGKHSTLQIIYIEITDNFVVDCVRFDATKNNREQVVKFLNGDVEKMTIDDYPDNKSDEELAELLGMADAIMIS